MHSNILIISGTLFLGLSGVIFAIERIKADLYWFILFNTGEYPTELNDATLYSNPFVIIFLILGIALITFGFIKRNKNL